MTTQISKLQKAGLRDLQEKYADLFGKPTKSRNRTWLFAKIAKKLQDQGEEPESAKKPVPLPTLVAKYERKKKGGAKGRTSRKPKKATESTRAQHREPGQRDPRLPKAGTTIERVYKGKKLLVRVLDEGFEYEGKPYRSLSALAQAITGAKAINGFLFFQLGKCAKQEKASK